MKKIFSLVLLLALFALLTVPALAQDKTGEANGFLEALKTRDIDSAAKFCDIKVLVDDTGDDTSANLGGVDPLAFCTQIAAKVADNWTVESDPKKIMFYKGMRLYDIHVFFPTETNYFVIGDMNNTAKVLDPKYVKEHHGSTVKASGWVIFLHKVRGKWLIHKAVHGGVILN